MFRYLPIFLLIFLFLPLKVFAFDTLLPNNKFGIHLAVPNESDINKAAELINSSGGKWGYITLVIQDNDRNSGKWQEIFNQLRRKHLIPIIRLATSPQGAVWKKPAKVDADGWASFLNGLNWPVKDRYIVLFNEPNHAAEWGGTVDAKDYAEVAAAFAQQLKTKNSDFFVMLSGFDASAVSSATSEDEVVFLQQMLQAKPDLFNYLDGWVSHSYPNPGFAGSPDDSGRGTIRGYEWELNYLKSLGVSKDLPVFITETGWSNEAVSLEQIGQNYVAAFALWVADSRVRAVTPFIFNYQQQPFLKFSWQKPDSEDFYPQFDAVKNLSKIVGEPQQEQKGTIIINSLPKELLVDSNYHFFVQLNNQGQAIWDIQDGYTLKLTSNDLQSYFVSDLDGIEPGEWGDAELFLKTKETQGQGSAKIALYKGEKKILDAGTWNFNILPLPSLNLEVSTFPGGKANGDKFELQVFDQNQQLVFRKRNFRIKGGKATITAIRNIYLGGGYRVVLLAPYYLPRQSLITFHKQINLVRFKVLLPLDFNLDGKFDWQDLTTLFKNPKLLKLYLP